MAVKSSETAPPSYSGPKVVEPASLLHQWLPGLPWFQGIAVQITQLFGPTDYTHEPAGFGVPHFHDGIDVAGMADGTDLISAINGTIDHIGYDPNGFGNYITVIPSYDPTKLILFGHLKDTKNYEKIRGNGGTPEANAPSIQWQAGEGLRVGDIIGHINSTGNSTGTHLHMSVYDTAGGGRVPIDPIDWLVLAPSKIGPGGTGTTPNSSANITPAPWEDFLDSLFFPNSPGAKRFGSSGKKLIFTIIGLGIMGLAVVLYFKPHVPSLSSLTSPSPSPEPSVTDIQGDSTDPRNSWNSTGLWRSYSGVSARGMRERYGNRNHKTRTVRLARR